MPNPTETAKAPAATGKSADEPIWKKVYQEIPRDVVLLICAFLVMCAVFAILKPQFLNFRNIINVIRTTAVVYILACGQTFAILSAGIDLSQGAIVSLVSVVTADIVIGALRAGGSRPARQAGRQE